MEITEAQKIGGRIAIRTFIIVVLLLEAIFFFRETRGDLANGILFFMAAHSYIYLIFLLVLTLLVWWLGRKAGKVILIDQKNYLVTGALYGAISIAVALVWIAICFLVIMFNLIITTRPPIWIPIAIELTAGPFMTIVLAIVWFLAALQIKRRKVAPGN